MQSLKNGMLRINRFFAEVCGWLLSVIMILLIMDFFSRGVSMPIQGVGEVAVFVMVASVYLGLGHTEQTKGNVRVTALINRLSPRAKNLVDLGIYVVALLTIGLVVYAATGNAIKAYRSQEAVAGTVPLPVWPVKWLIVVGCVLYFLQLVVNTLDALGKVRAKEA